MVYEVKCEIMVDGWNYESCYMCKRFSLSLTSKGRQWRCKLNNSNAHERRMFRLIWAEEFLRARGVKISETTISVVYIGKRKK
jgi:hypothetical protein